MIEKIESIIIGFRAGIATLEHANEAWVGTAPDQPHLCCSPADLRALLAELDRLREVERRAFEPFNGVADLIDRLLNPPVYQNGEIDDHVAIADMAEAASYLSSLVLQNEKLTADLAFSDEQSAKVEALLEPHIKWDDAVKKEINASADRIVDALSNRTQEGRADG